MAVAAAPVASKRKPVAVATGVKSHAAAPASENITTSGAPTTDSAPAPRFNPAITFQIFTTPAAVTPAATRPAST